MRYQVLTILPELLSSFKEKGLIGRACEQGQIDLDLVQLRDFAINAHGQLDDTPYGGGSGMVLRCDAAAKAISAAKEKDPNGKVVLFTPRGRQLTAGLAQEIVRSCSESGGGLILLPYRYEGFDERIAEQFADYELSIGDFVLMGGEVAAMALIEATARFVPGVLGNSESVVEESFQQSLLEYPQYTKPPEFEGRSVPKVLLSGNHAEIKRWRQARALNDSLKRRPDLLSGVNALPACDLSVALIHFPVVDKSGEVITSSITNLDVHDISRSATTYGLGQYYIVHPTKALRSLTEKICEHWESGYGSTYNANRSQALRSIKVLPDFNDVLSDIETRTGSLPKIITTSARDSEKSVTFTELRGRLSIAQEPHLLLLGTGWGLAEEIIKRADYHLEPVKGYTDYNHLSVRAAAAVIFDRLFGKHQ